MFWQACYVWSWLAVNAEVAVILLLTRVSAYIGMPCGQSSAPSILQSNTLSSAKLATSSQATRVVTKCTGVLEIAPPGNALLPKRPHGRADKKEGLKCPCVLLITASHDSVAATDATILIRSKSSYNTHCCMVCLEHTTLRDPSQSAICSQSDCLTA